MSYANRGKWLENVIERDCKIYEDKNIALINKIPTPTQVIRRGKQIKGAYYESKSTVDFIGIHDGKFVAFDTKEIKGKSFPFRIVHDHQIKYLAKAHNMRGTAFLIVYFTDYKEAYRISITDFIKYKKNADRKSIPYDYFKDHCKLLKSRNGLALNFLEK